MIDPLCRRWSVNQRENDDRRVSIVNEERHWSHSIERFLFSMSPTRRDSSTDITNLNDNDEQQPFTTSKLSSRVDRRKSSIAAIFDDNRRRDDTKLPRPNLRRLWAKYDVPYVIGEEVFETKRTICETILVVCSWFLLILFFPFSLFLTLKIVQEYERVVIFRLGRLNSTSAHGPGMCFTLPCIDTIHLVDIRTVSFDVPPQEVLTRDSVTVAVDAVVYYRVFNPTVSIANVENAQESTHLLAQTSLRNVLGTRLLSELLGDRGAVSNMMRECLDEATDNWGIKVERVEIKDVRLPKMLQRIMAAEAEAAREAKAKVCSHATLSMTNPCWSRFRSSLAKENSKLRELWRKQQTFSLNRRMLCNYAICKHWTVSLPNRIPRSFSRCPLNYFPCFKRIRSIRSKTRRIHSLSLPLVRQRHHQLLLSRQEWQQQISEQRFCFSFGQCLRMGSSRSREKQHANS